MSASEAVFADHPVNQARRKAGKRPVTNVWLWGQGSAPRLESFEQLYGVRGAMITAVDLLRGLAKLIGWKRIDVPGATGYLDTDYAAKGRYAVEALKEHDLVCVHVEAPDEASHEGRADAKIEALEQIDRHIVAPVFAALQGYPQWRILVSPDHPTPVRTKTHSHGDVPMAIAGSGIQPDGFDRYDDPTAARSGLVFREGWRAMGYFITGRHLHRARIHGRLPLVGSAAPRISATLGRGSFVEEVSNVSVLVGKGRSHHRRTLARPVLADIVRTSGRGRQAGADRAFRIGGPWNDGSQQ